MKTTRKSKKSKTPKGGRHLNGSPIETPDPTPVTPPGANKEQRAIIIEANRFFTERHQQALASVNVWTTYMSDLMDVITAISRREPIPADKAHFFIRKYVMQYFGWSGEPIEWSDFLQQYNNTV